MADGAAHYNPDDFAKLRLVEDAHFWFVSRNNILAAALRTLTAEGFEAKSVLEVGCGTGNTLRVLRESFPDAALVGMDAYHAGLLQHGPDRRAAGRRPARAPALPQEVLQIGCSTLEHIEDDPGCCRRCEDHRTGCGRPALTVPADRRRGADDEECQHQRCTPPGIGGRFDGGAFRIEYLTCS